MEIDDGERNDSVRHMGSSEVIKPDFENSVLKGILSWSSN
jgi:hypothetical protein